MGSDVWSLEEAFGAMFVITSNNVSFLVSPTLIRSSILPWLFQLSEVYVNSQFPSQVLLWLQLKSLLLCCLFTNCLSKPKLRSLISVAMDPAQQSSGSSSWIPTGNDNIPAPAFYVRPLQCLVTITWQFSHERFLLLMAPDCNP